MFAALLCRVDPTREADRLRLRADHLAYIVAHRQRIIAGGPTLNPTGAPEMMIICIEANDLADAESFIRAEPYTHNGVFDHVDIRAWARVLPETHAGALDQALAAERAKRGGGGT